MRPHRRQPTRLPYPWDSPGKNTGVGCHFLLQCMKVKSESEVAQSCPTLSDPTDCSLPGSSVHGSFQARVLEWVVIAFSGMFSLTLLFSTCTFNSGIFHLWDYFLKCEILPKFRVIQRIEKGKICQVFGFLNCSIVDLQCFGLWQPTPVLLPGNSHRQRSLVGCSLWGR